jgi:hypothetical protein
MFAGAGENLAAAAARSGVTSVDGRYTSVSDAAKACGIWDEIAASFKLLSKYTHPTALLIKALPDETTLLLRDIFFSQGCLFFFGAFICSKVTLPVSTAHGTTCAVESIKWWQAVIASCDSRMIIEAVEIAAGRINCFSMIAAGS